jgi:Flp pilus assembly protein TadG
VSRGRLRPCSAAAWSNEGGQAIALYVVAMVSLLGMAALAIDVGHFFLASRRMQASSDAVATALANQLQDVRTGKTTLAAAEANATAYGIAAGQKNGATDVTGVSLTFTPKCLTVNGSVPAWCTSSTPNAVTIRQTATVDTTFAKVIGINSGSIGATSTASIFGGKPISAHIVIVFDRTNSMNNACTSGGTKLICARDGIDAFLTGMDPAYDKVGLVAFPPSTGAACSFFPKNTDGPTTDYDAYPNGYVQVALSTDYKASANAALNQSSTLVTDVGCLKAAGTTSTAPAIDAAQALLMANHDPKAQDVIVFFTDGEANYGPCASPNGQGVCSNNGSPYRATPCHQVDTSAAASAAAGTWVYTIAYDPGSVNCWGWKSTGTGTDGQSCAKRNGYQFRCAEVPSITAYDMIKTAASDATKFYETPAPSSLVTIFQNIATDITGTRLVDDNYTGN